jgi:uncharacterized protein YhfF
MGNANEVEEFWQAYLASRPEGEPAPVRYEAWAFGRGQAMADELGDLVVRGVKTATASLWWEYEAGDETVPQAGDLSVILDGAGRPLCVIETTQVEIKPFQQVDAAFAFDEGEGDRSLDYWRRAHWHFFGESCRELGRAPAEDMPVACERFRVVYRSPVQENAGQPAND